MKQKQAKNKPGRPPKVTPEAVQTAELMLSRRYHKGEIKRVLQALHGLAPRTCEDVMTEAKACLVNASEKDREAHRNDAYRFYDAILRDGLASAREKIRAQERIDKLLGLEAPVKHEIGGEIKHSGRIDLAKLSTEELKTLEQIAERAAGPGPDQG